MLAEGGLDLMVVIGGYNSSNTQALARICAAKLPTFHIDSPESVTPGAIRHRPIGSHQLVETAGWLPAGAVTVGLTAGASTPNNVVGEVVARILAARGSVHRRPGPRLGDGRWTASSLRASTTRAGRRWRRPSSTGWRTAARPARSPPGRSPGRACTRRSPRP